MAQPRPKRKQKKPSTMFAEMLRKGPSLSACLLFLFLVWDPSIAIALKSDDGLNLHTLITKEQRRTFASTDFGEISALDVDAYGGPYHLQFITMEPNSLFLPVLLQTDMVFYVDTGSGRIGWVDDRNKYRMDIQRGDIYRLESGSIFYVQSYAETPIDKLRIYALFSAGPAGAIGENSQENFLGVYLNLSDLVLGFDKKVLQMAFKVSEDVIEVITNAEKPPSIVHMTAKRRTDDYLRWKAERIEAFSDVDDSQVLRDSKRALNIFRRNKDFESSDGWSVAVNYRNLNALKGSNIGVFMVNLNEGSMMEPHWNPQATEIVIVIHGQGMVQLLCSSNAPDCKNTRFKVKEGDVIIVPPFHPMAQFSFNSDSLILMGFTKMERENQAQFLAGKKSVFRNINADILAMSFNVPSTTIRQLLSVRREATISACAFCAEEEEEKLVEEIEKQKEEEEAKKRKEEEERKREEEEKKRKEEEEARKREEEERKRKEEEEKKRKEEEEKKRKEEEEKKRKEEEERKRKEEEEAKKRQEEEEKKRREEEERKRKEEEEEAKKRQEEEERKRKEEEEAKKRQEEEERKRKEEEEAKKRQEEEERKRKEDEEAKKRQEEEERKRKEEEEAKKRQEEEERKREEEEAKKRQEEEERRRKEEEEAKKRQEEEERRRKEEEEAKKRQEEEEKKKEEEEARKKKEEEAEAARKKKEEERRIWKI